MKLFGFSKNSQNMPEQDHDDEYIRIINQANAQHDEILRNAIIDKEALLSYAKAERDRIIHDAEVKSAEMISEAESVLSEAKKKYERTEHQALSDIRDQKREIEQELQRMQEDMRDIERIAKAYDANPWDSFEMKNAEYAEKIKLIQQKVTELIDNKRAAININAFETNEEIKEYDRKYKQITRLFCAEADLISIEAKTKPFASVNRKIAKAFKDINRLFEKENIAISEFLLELKIQQCIAVYYSNKE